MNLETIVSIAAYVPMPEGMGLPCLFEGPPGVGKSARIKAAARARNLPFRAVYLPSKQPEDLAGLPVPTRSGVQWECGLSAVRELNSEGQGVLVFEEVNWATRAVQSALLSVVLERQVGDTKVHPAVRMFLAANSVDEGDGGHAMLTTLGNRVAHFRVERPAVDEYLSFRQGVVRSERLDVEATEKHLRANWDEAHRKANAIHCGFIKRRGEAVLHKQPPVGSPDRGKAWPSPRSWDAAVRATATCMVLGEERAIPQFMRAIVGEGAAKEYAAYVANWDLPTPEEMLRGDWSPNSMRPDVALAAYAGVTGYALDQQTPAERANTVARVWGLLGHACQAGLVDVAYTSIARLLDAGFGARAKSRDVAIAARKVLDALQKSGALVEALALEGDP